MENYILIYCFFWISDVQKMKINQTVLKEFILVGFSVYPHVQTSFLWFFFAPTFSPSQVTWPSWVLPGWTDISTHSCTSSLVHSPFLSKTLLSCSWNPEYSQRNGASVLSFYLSFVPRTSAGMPTVHEISWPWVLKRGLLECDERHGDWL